MTGTAAGLPVSYWRGLLDSRWQAEVRRITELSLAFYDLAEHTRAFASAAGPAGSAGPAGTAGGEPRLAAGPLRRAESRAVAARRCLADVEDAMGRLTAGSYGRCEQCGTDMPARWLARIPEARYCPHCSPGAAAAGWLARSPATRPLLTRLLAPLAARLRHALHLGVIAVSPGNG